MVQVKSLNVPQGQRRVEQKKERKKGRERTCQGRGPGMIANYLLGEMKLRWKLHGEKMGT